MSKIIVKYKHKNVKNVDTTKNIDKQTKGLKRTKLDKYYTNNTIVDTCINLVNSTIIFTNKKEKVKSNKIKQNDNNIKKNNTNTNNNNNNQLIIEPSAGNGSFINSIKSLSNNHIFYDLEPEHSEIIKQNFLELDTEQFKNKYDKIHMIGNPPFGRQSSLAIKFIKKACQFVDTISFILPKSFKKDSLKKHFNNYFHLINEIDLPKNAFYINNDEQCDVPCVFQIWEKKSNLRDIKEKIKPNKFIFIKKTDNPDISFRRVGVNAGNIDTNITDKSIQSHYFIKFTNNKKIEDNLILLKKLKFTHENTVGPRSISKQELIEKFNEIIIT